MTVKVTISICTPQSGYPLLSLRLSSFLQKLEVNRQAVASVSLRLGHARALTPHCGVIHSPRAASLPTKGKPYKESSPPWRLVRAVRLSRTAEDVCPYKSWGRSFANVMFGSCRLFATAAASHRPTAKMEIYLVGGGALRRPATLFARSFGGEGCSLLPMPPSEREGDHGRVPESECNELLGFVRVVEGACVILKFALSLLLRTLPQSPLAPAPSRREPLKCSPP